MPAHRERLERLIADLKQAVVKTELLLTRSIDDEILQTASEQLSAMHIALEQLQKLLQKE
jgi:hypothetical protein